MTTPEKPTLADELIKAVESADLDPHVREALREIVQVIVPSVDPPDWEGIENGARAIISVVDSVAFAAPEVMRVHHQRVITLLNEIAFASRVTFIGAMDFTQLSRPALLRAKAEVGTRLLRIDEALAKHDAACP